MPVTKSAKRALRVSQRRAAINLRVRKQYKQRAKDAQTKKTPTTLRGAYHALDVAAKKGIIHWKKAARLKSRLAKRITKPKRKRNVK